MSIKKVLSLLVSLILIFSLTVTSFAFTWKSTDGNGRSITENDDSVAEVRDKIYKALISELELNHAAACGVLGNIWAECCFDYQSTGAYNGICQWDRNGRWASCKKKFGTSLNDQIKFLCWELTEGSYKSVYSDLLKVENTEDGALEAEQIFRTRYEGCGNQGRTRRRDATSKYFKSLKITTAENKEEKTSTAVTEEVSLDEDTMTKAAIVVLVMVKQALALTSVVS